MPNMGRPQYNLSLGITYSKYGGLFTILLLICINFFVSLNHVDAMVM